MKVILLQGCADKGKTRLSNKIDEWLLQNNFIEEFKKLDPNNENANPYQRDFWAVYNKNINGENVRIFLNSWSDTGDIINAFRDIYKENQKEGYNILITAIRSKNNPRLHEWTKEVYNKELSKIEEFILDLDTHPQDAEYWLGIFICIFNSLI